MTNEKKPSTPKEVFARHGEKAGLVLALLALLAYGVTAFGISEEDRNVQQVGLKSREIARQMSLAHPDHKAPEIKDWQAIAVGSWGTVIATPKSADDWAGSLLTSAKGTPVAKAIIRKKPVLMAQIVYGETTVEIDSITVNWSFQDFTLQEKQKKEKEFDFAPPTHVLLEREVGGNGTWQAISEKLDPKTLSFKDSKIEPKTKYAYRVTSYTTDKGYLERGGTPHPLTGGTPNPEGRGTVATGTPVTTMGIWKLTFINPSKKEGADKGTVWVKIEKFEKGHGKVEKGRLHHAGERIGWWEESPGADPVSIHRVSGPQGRSISVDFNSGVTLVSVEPIKLPVEVKRCKPIYDKKTGNKIGCDKISEKRNFDTTLIVTTDDEGEHRVYSPNPGDLNQLCEVHDGRGINPDKLAIDQKIVDAQKAEVEAEKLYAEAESLATKDGKKAIRLYERLLKEFGATDFVSKGKKVIIEERLGVLKARQ